MKINQSQIFIILNILLQCISAFKPDQKKADITNSKVKDNPKYKTECTIKEKCRECTLEELKNTIECQSSGYKQLKHCSYYDKKKLMDENYFAEPCNENMKTNSVYIFLIFCIIIGLLSFFIRRSHKNLKLNQMFEKLTIIRKHN